MSRVRLAPKDAKRYHIDGFNVVATQFEDYRVDAVIREFPKPVPGPSFPTLEQAKQHIEMQQKILAGVTH